MRLGGGNRTYHISYKRETLGFCGSVQGLQQAHGRGRLSTWPLREGRDLSAAILSQGFEPFLSSGWALRFACDTIARRCVAKDGSIDGRPKGCRAETRPWGTVEQRDDGGVGASTRILIRDSAVITKRYVASKCCVDCSESATPGA